MMKEIHEQPDAVAETIADRLPELDRVDLSELELATSSPAQRAPDRDRRLRHLLPRGPRRPLRDRAVGAGPGRDGYRLGVPLSRSGRRSDDDLVIGITQSGETADTLAAMRLGSRARRQRARDHQRDGQPGHPGRRLRPLHPRRDRDRGRGDEDVREPGRGDVHARALARAGARNAAPGADRRADRRAEGAPAPDQETIDRRRRAGEGDRAQPRAAALLPLPRPQHRASRLPRGGAEAEGDLLHPRPTPTPPGR